MSTAFNKRKKEKKRLRSAEERALRRKIRNGVYPALHFAKDKRFKLEREVHPKYPYRTRLTWVLKSTLKELMG